MRRKIEIEQLIIKEIEQSIPEDYELTGELSLDGKVLGCY